MQFVAGRAGPVSESFDPASAAAERRTDHAKKHLVEDRDDKDFFAPGAGPGMIAAASSQLGLSQAKSSGSSMQGKSTSCSMQAKSFREVAAPLARQVWEETWEEYDVQADIDVALARQEASEEEKGGSSSKEGGGALKEKVLSIMDNVSLLFKIGSGVFSYVTQIQSQVLTNSPSSLGVSGTGLMSMRHAKEEPVQKVGRLAPRVFTEVERRDSFRRPLDMVALELDQRFSDMWGDYKVAMRRVEGLGVERERPRGE
ncbi:MAG: hypothetical protein WDW38_003541 [Sanguina aurantia]